jgi:hypothetical protein
VVLVGGSSTGKTRLAYETVHTELPDWRLYHPADTAELTSAVAGQQLPQAGWVVWLDEIQHYLTSGLTLATVRALLDPERPMLLLATMWPAWYEQLTSRPAMPPGPGRAAEADPNRDARHILTTTTQAVIHLGDFTDQERHRARQLAEQDPRLGTALGDPDFGPTQVLAGAPCWWSAGSTPPTSTPKRC